METTLSLAEVRIATWLGQARHQAARSAGVRDVQIGTQDKLDIDINGVGAEIAFCKLFNYYPDLSVGARSGGADCFDSLGLSYDVKCTKRPQGSLLATLKKAQEEIDYYVLMVGELPTYKLIGVVRHEDLFKPENIKDLGHGKGYCLSYNDVIKLSDPLYDPKNVCSMRQEYSGTPLQVV